MIKVLSEGKKMKGYKYQDDNLALRKWKAKEDISKSPEPDMKAMIAEASRSSKDKEYNLLIKEGCPPEEARRRVGYDTK
jgi:thymidylate synthase ThyX